MSVTFKDELQTLRTNIKTENDDERLREKCQEKDAESK